MQAGLEGTYTLENGGKSGGGDVTVNLMPYGFLDAAATNGVSGIRYGESNLFGGKGY